MANVGVIAGNFDVIHPGYIFMFNECKKHCDTLLLLLHDDPSIERPDKIKPILSLEELWFYHHSNKLIKSSRIKLNPIYIRFSKKTKLESDFLVKIIRINHSPEMIWACRFIILIVPMVGALQNLRN